MTDEGQIKIFAALDFIKNNAKPYAIAKAQRIHLEEYRKTKKALCMKTAERAGHNTAAAQEREAYADPDYAELLDGLKEATEKEETLRWLIVAAQASIEVWRTIEANKRAEAKVL